MKNYTIQFLKFTLADLTEPAKQSELAQHLWKMSNEQGWNFVELHPAGSGVVVIYSRDSAPNP